MQKFVTIRPWVSFPRMRDFAHKKVLVLGVFFVIFSFFGFLQLAIAKAAGRILTQNISKHAVPRKDVPFWGRFHKT